MDRFYKAKIEVLVKERKSHADSIKALVEEIENGDVSPVTVHNILGHASALLEVTAKIEAYNMSKQMQDIYSR